MQLDLSHVQFSKNDLKAGIKIPTHLTTDLAYETGVHAGDGYLGIHKRKSGCVYTIIYSGNLTEEVEYYNQIVCPLVFKLYNKKVSISARKKHALSVDYKSKAIATFKKNVIGLPNGAKIGKLRIPEIIMHATGKIKAAFLAGLADTDFSLVFVKKGKYPKITASFPEQDQLFVSDVIQAFSDIGITAIACLANAKDARYTPTKVYKYYKIDINGRENLYKWLKVFGFQSAKHLTKLALWEKYGCCPKYTTIAQRKERLSSSEFNSNRVE